MMEFTDQDLAALAAYWSSEMSEKDRTDLELRFKNEPEFKAAADHFRRVEMSLDEVKVRQWLMDTPLEKSKTTKAKEYEILPIVKWAASFAIVAATAYFGYYWFNTNPYSAYYKQVFKAPTSREMVMQVPNLEIKALEAYDQEKFKKALPLLYTVFKNSDNKDSIKLFYIAISHLALQQPEQAIPILNEMQTSDKAKNPKWYLALAYLLQNDTQNAKPLLEELSQSDEDDLKAKAKEGLDLIAKNNSQ
jgi:tetratricopeptide (TPR) repeat protein